MDDKTGFFVTVVVLLLAAAGFLLGAFLIRRQDRSFAQNAVKTQAVLVGCQVEDFSSTEQPQVRFTDETGREVFTTAQSVTFRKPRCPNGTVLQVAYCKKKTLGLNFYDLRVQDDRYIRQSRISAFVVCGGIGVLLLAIAVFVFVMSFF